MKMLIGKTIGKRVYKFEVEGENLFECVMQSQRLGFNDVYKCGMCESEKLYLSAYITKEGSYEYTKIVCANCGGSITFGQTKKDKNCFFLRRNEDKTYAWQKKVNG